MSTVRFFPARDQLADRNQLAGLKQSGSAAADDTNPKEKALAPVESDHVNALKIAKAGKQPTNSVSFFATPTVVTQDISDLAKALDLATNRETVKIEADLLDATRRSNPEESSPNVFRLR